MRKLLAVGCCLAVGLLAGCNKEKSAEELLIESAQQTIALQLKDPQSVQFRNMKGSERAKMVCGELNAKNGMGGYVGFKRFMVGGAIDTASHTFEAGATTLIEAPEPTVGPVTPGMTPEQLRRFLDDAVKVQRYADEMRLFQDCEKVVPMMKQIEAQERKAKETVFGKMADFFRGTND